MGVTVGTPDMYDTILVPVDGSDRSERAAAQAIDVAAAHDARVYALSVIDSVSAPEPALSSVELVTDAMEERAMADLAGVAARATAAGVDVQTRVSHGVPHREIVEQAEDVGADLVVVGASGGSSERELVRRVDRAVDCEVRAAE